MFRIAPSILSANFAKLGEEVKAVIDSGADIVHFDVMDNHYVPNLTIGPLVCEAIRPVTDAIIDVHLMVEPVDRIIPDFAKAGANIISFHPEASRHIDRTIGLIKEQGCKAGLVFNPATPLSYLDHVLDKLDITAPEAIFVDDFPENIAAANALGLHGILFRPQDDVRSAILARLG